MADSFYLKRRKQRKGSNPAPKVFILNMTMDDSSYTVTEGLKKGNTPVKRRK